MNRLKTFTILGAGKVGTTLGALFQQKSCFNIQQIYARNSRIGLRAKHFMQAVDCVDNMQQLKPAEIFLITTPDGNIRAIAQELVDNNLITPGTIVFHCSGFYSCEIIANIRSLGGYVASVHPAKTFADIQQSLDTFSGTVCALEGDEKACCVLENGFSAIGAQIYKIKTEDKPLWHLAQVFASNYLNGIYAVAENLLKPLLTQEQIKCVLIPLMRNTLINIQNKDVSRALTGPIARGDHKTVESHIHVLKMLDPTLANIYKLMGKKLLELAKTTTNPYSLSEIEALFKE